MQRNDERYDCVMAALKAARDYFSMLSTNHKRRDGVDEVIHNLENTESFDSIWFNEYVVQLALAHIQEHLECIGSEHPRATVALQAIEILDDLNRPSWLLQNFARELWRLKRILRRFPTEDGCEALKHRCAHLRDRIRQEAEALAATYDISQHAKCEFVEKAVEAENDEMSWLINKFFDLLPTANDDI